MRNVSPWYVRSFAAALLAAPVSALGDGPVFTSPVLDVGDGSIGHAFWLGAGDFDGDGVQDLAASVNGEGTKVHLGAGDGTFGPAIELLLAGNQGLTVADLDADGLPDLIAGSGQDSVGVALNLGGGAFAAPVAFPTASGASQPGVADFDGDGHLDLAVPCDETIRVSILLGDGTGNFTPQPDVGPTGDGGRFLAVADIDGDAHLDLAVAAVYAGTITLLLGDGTGGFTHAGVLDAISPEGIQLADLDGDGDADLVHKELGGVAVRANDGAGGFGPPVLHDSGGAVGQVLVADVDEDGVPDLVNAAFDVSFTVFLGHGDLTFAPPLVFGGDLTPDALALADWNGDGDLDLAVSGAATTTVSILSGFGDGTFAPHHHTGGGGTDLELVDLDGDGWLDLVTADALDDTLSVLRNAASLGRFEQAVTIAGTERIEHVASGDLDGDGDPDVAAANAQLFGGVLWTLANDGTGQLGAPVATAVSNDLVDLELAELDGEAGLDAIVVSNGLHAAYTLLNQGDGSFAAPTTHGTALAPLDATTGDLDGDGDIDFAVAHDSSQARVDLFFNDGTGAFGAGVPTSAWGLDHHITAGDADGDGDLDLVTSGKWSGNVALLRNQGGGVFDPVQSLGTFPWQPGGVDLGDVDADGLTDIVFARQHEFFDEGSFVTLLNQGDGTYLEEVTAVPANALTLAVADLDRDGVDDVAVTSRVGRQVTVLSSTRGPWDDLGHPLAGTLGLPRQTGEGSLQPGADYRFTLTDARPSTQVFHVVGLSLLEAPFKGGVLVPSPDLVNPFAVTDAEGTAVLEGPWIGAPSGLQLFLQFWIPDPAGEKGFAASGAVVATMP